MGPYTREHLSDSILDLAVMNQAKLIAEPGVKPMGQSTTPKIPEC
jgi:hypothetical protein